MNDENYKIIEAMETYGGSFVQALADAFRRADPSNFHKLKHTFSEYWEKYKEMAQGRPTQNEGHKSLMLDLQILLQEADDFAFDDFKNEKYAAPKVALANRLEDLRQNVINGKYDQ